jgi:ribonucleoside-triphosphate reductase
MAKMLLEKANYQYQLVDAVENKELAIKFQVKKAPTLFVPTEEGYDVFDNVSDIKKYIEGLK